MLRSAKLLRLRRATILTRRPYRVESRSEIRIEKDPKLFEVCTKSIFSPFMHHLWELVHFKNPTLCLNVVTLSGDGVLYIDVECLCDVLEALEGSTLPSWTCLSDLKSYLTRSSGRASPPQLPKCTCTVTPLGAPKSENSSVLEFPEPAFFWSLENIENRTPSGVNLIYDFLPRAGPEIDWHYFCGTIRPP